MASRSDGKTKVDAVEITKRIEEKYDRFRKMYPEVRGKKVDFIKHWMEENILFFSVRFMDGTNFCIQYEPTVELVGAEYSDMKTGDTVILKEYFRRRDY
jgi:hypothetical protein